MTTLVPSFLDGSSSFLPVSWTNIKALLSLNFGFKLILSPTTSEKSMYNVVTTQAPSFLIGYSSFLQVTRSSIQAWMSLDF